MPLLWTDPALSLVHSTAFLIVMKLISSSSSVAHIYDIISEREKIRKIHFFLFSSENSMTADLLSRWLVHSELDCVWEVDPASSSS